jgi:type IV secretion system protein VirB5
VVEVAELGQARAFGPAERMPTSELERAVTAELAEFITNARRIVADVGAQREIILEAYAFADERARTFLNHHYSQAQNDPRLLSQRIRRTISIESILKMPDSDSYKVRWTEREIGRTSASALRTSWEGILAVRIVPPETEADILVNPLGVKIYDINWSQMHTVEE